MRSPIKREGHHFFRAPNWIVGTVIRFKSVTNPHEIGAWYNSETKRYRNDRWNAEWTLRQLKREYPELYELEPTQKLVRTGDHR